MWRVVRAEPAVPPDALGAALRRGCSQEVEGQHQGVPLADSLVIATAQCGACTRSIRGHGSTLAHMFPPSALPVLRTHPTLPSEYKYRVQVAHFCVQVEPGGVPELPSNAQQMPIGKYFDLRGVDVRPARQIGTHQLRAVASHTFAPPAAPAFRASTRTDR